MNIVIPMAGRGSRLRPHTLTVPKPLVPVGGKPIVERLAEDIVAMSAEPVEEIAFVIGDFGAEVEAQLLAVAERLGAKGHICYQDEPLGTAHAILCGAACLTGTRRSGVRGYPFPSRFHHRSDRGRGAVCQTSGKPQRVRRGGHR